MAKFSLFTQPLDRRILYVLGFSPSLKIKAVAKAEINDNPHPRAKARGNSCPSLLK